MKAMDSEYVCKVIYLGAKTWCYVHEFVPNIHDYCVIISVIISVKVSVKVSVRYTLDVWCK